MVGYSQGRVTGAKQFPVAPPISLEGDVGCVKVAAVRLDDESVFGPEKVHLDTAASDFHRRIEQRGGEVALQN